MDNDGLSQAQGVHAGATEGEMTAMQYQKHTASECEFMPNRLVGTWFCCRPTTTDSL